MRTAAVSPDPGCASGCNTTAAQIASMTPAHIASSLFAAGPEGPFSSPKMASANQGRTLRCCSLMRAALDVRSLDAPIVRQLPG